MERPQGPREEAAHSPRGPCAGHSTQHLAPPVAGTAAPRSRTGQYPGNPKSGLRPPRPAPAPQHSLSWGPRNLGWRRLSWATAEDWPGSTQEPQSPALWKAWVRGPGHRQAHSTSYADQIPVSLQCSRGNRKWGMHSPAPLPGTPVCWAHPSGPAECTLMVYPIPQRHSGHHMEPSAKPTKSYTRNADQEPEAPPAVLHAAI